MRGAASPTSRSSTRARSIRELRPLLGNRIYGCDDCLAACPWNKFAQGAREAAFVPRAELTAPRLAELAALDDAAFRRRFAGTAIKRIGRDRFVRNVAYALGNSGAPSTALPALARLLATRRLWCGVPRAGRRRG